MPSRRKTTVDDPAALPLPAVGELDQSSLMHLVGYAATRASVTLKRAFSRAMADLELKPVEFSILVVLASNRQVNQKQLCHALDLSAPNLAVVLDRLEARGLVRRERSTTDRRESLVRLTPSGRSLQQRAAQIAATHENESTRVLSAAERALLIELLHKVVKGRASRRSHSG